MALAVVTIVVITLDNDIIIIIITVTGKVTDTTVVIINDRVSFISFHFIHSFGMLRLRLTALVLH